MYKLPSAMPVYDNSQTIINNMVLISIHDIFVTLILKGRKYELIL